MQAALVLPYAYLMKYFCWGWGWGDGAWALTQESHSPLGEVHVLGRQSGTNSIDRRSPFSLYADPRDNLHWLEWQQTTSTLLNLWLLSSLPFGVNHIYLTLQKWHVCMMKPLQLGDQAIVSPYVCQLQHLLTLPVWPRPGEHRKVFAAPSGSVHTCAMIASVL